MNPSGSFFPKRDIWRASFLLPLPKIPFQTTPSCEGDLGKSLSLGLSLASCSQVHSTLLSIHEKHNLSLTKTHKLDPDSNTRLPLPWAPLGVGRLPMQGLHGELLQEDGWAGWWAAFLYKASSGGHCGAPYSMLCPCREVLCLAVPRSGWGIHAGVPLGLLACRLCLAWVLPQGWADLGLASLGLNCCFLWEKERAEQAALDGMQGEFLYVSYCMIVPGMIHCAKTCFSFTWVLTAHSITELPLHVQLKVINCNDDTVEERRRWKLLLSSGNYCCFHFHVNGISFGTDESPHISIKYFVVASPLYYCVFSISLLTIKFF